MQPVRFSHLRAYGRSAAHGHHARQVEMQQTRDMQRGTAVHALLFGTRPVVGYPGAVRRGKEYEAFVKANADAEILTMNEYTKARDMAEAIRSSTVAAPFLQGTCENTILFRWMGLDCRATPDVHGDGFLTEIKTSSTAEPVRFTWHALRMAYHAQMRMQQIAAQSECRCIIVCCEAEAPYPVQVFEIDKRTLEIGEKLLVTWAERLKNCEASGVYPPYSTSIFPLCAPEDLELQYGDE